MTRRISCKVIADQKMPLMCPLSLIANFAVHIPYRDLTSSSLHRSFAGQQLGVAGNIGALPSGEIAQRRIFVELRLFSLNLR